VASVHRVQDIHVHTVPVEQLHILQSLQPVDAASLPPALNKLAPASAASTHVGERRVGRARSLDGFSGPLGAELAGSEAGRDAEGDGEADCGVSCVDRGFVRWRQAGWVEWSGGENTGKGRATGSA